MCLRENQCHLPKLHVSYSVGQTMVPPSLLSCSPPAPQCGLPQNPGFCCSLHQNILSYLWKPIHPSANLPKIMQPQSGSLNTFSGLLCLRLCIHPRPASALCISLPTYKMGAHDPPPGTLVRASEIADMENTLVLDVVLETLRPPNLRGRLHGGDAKG